MLDWNPWRPLRKLFADRAEMDRFFVEVCSPSWHASTTGASRPRHRARMNDDANENLEAARKLGFQPVLFRSSRQFRADLEAVGVLARSLVAQ